MKKTIIALLALLVIPCMAAEVMESVISADASVTNEYAPDTATIRFYVENSGTNLAELKTKNDATVNAAITEIKKKLTDKESIKTIAFSINNVYSYKDKIRIFQKYEVKNGFEVKLKDLSKVSQIIQTAMDKGVKKVDRLNFSIENGEQLCNEMMAKAIVTAKNRAQYLSSAANSQLDKPKNINAYCSLSSSVVQPRYYANSSMKMAMTEDAAGDAGAVETIEPGAITVRANVSMSYYLK